jgi:hypothetical protein
VVEHSRRIGFAVDAGHQRNGLLFGYEDLLRLLPPDDKSLRVDYSSEGSISFSIQSSEEQTPSLGKSDGNGPAPEIEEGNSGLSGVSDDR